MIKSTTIDNNNFSPKMIYHYMPKLLKNKLKTLLTPII